MGLFFDSLYFFWKFWVHLFTSVPYGDPYLATLAFMLLLAFVGLLIKKVME